jgi:hypothetical protein
MIIFWIFILAFCIALLERLIHLSALKRQKNFDERQRNII